MRNKLPTTIILLLIVALAIWLRLYNIESKPIWYDETISISHAEKPLGFYFSSFRVSYKPLYFFLLHQWINLFDENTVPLRIFSVIWGVLNIFLLFKLVRLILDKETALLSAFLFAISVFHIFHCQQVRQFSLLTFLATASFYFFIKYFRDPRAGHGVILLLTNILLINTYPTGFFPVLIEFVFACLFIRGEAWRRWCVSQIILALFLLRWLVVSDKRQMAEMVWWIQRPGWASVWETINTFSWGGPRYGLDDFIISMPWSSLMWLLSFIYIVLLVRGFIQHGQTDRISLLVYMWLILPVAVIFLSSLLSDISVFAIKHLMISLPAFCILVAKGLRGVRTGWRMALLGGVVLLNCIPLCIMYNTAFASDWAQSTDYVKSNIKHGETIIVSSLSEVVTFMYYFDKKGRTLEDMDIYGKITSDNYRNNVFIGGRDNLIVGIKQTGFGDDSLSAEDDFWQKISKHGEINKKPVWLMLSRWSEPGIRDVLLAYFKKILHIKECLQFQGVEVCYFEPENGNGQ